jgi:hypothetical protein
VERYPHPNHNAGHGVDPTPLGGTMKRSTIMGIFVVSLLALKIPSAAAQYQAATPDLDHGQIGVFADCFRLSQTSTNFAGVGARLGFERQSLFIL